MPPVPHPCTSRGAAQTTGKPGRRGCGAARGVPLQRRSWMRPPATVWPCAPRDKTDAAVGWLERAVVKIVTTYTKPGQRVLLVAPPPTRPSPDRWNTTAARRWPPDAYQILSETNWTVSRLGRSVQVTLVEPATQDPPHRRCSASGPLRALSPRRAASSGVRHGVPDRQADRIGAGTRTGTDARSDRPNYVECFDLILTAAHPLDHAWIATRNWRQHLRPNGTLTIITNSDISEGRLADPITSLVTTLSQQRMRLLDHAILLTSPPAHPQDVLAGFSGRAARRPLRHRPNHHDLLVFANPTEGVR